jgi:hypothetical protein
MTPEEELSKSKENFARLGVATIRAITNYPALLRASHELLSNNKYPELALLQKKYLPEELEKEEIGLENSDAALAAIMSALREQG